MPSIPSIRLPMVKSGRAKRGARKLAVTDSLIDLFLDDGFLDLSVDDMAAHAHCSKRTIYVVGDSKEQVILTVIRGFFKRATDWIAQRMDAKLAPIDQIGQYLRLIAEALAPASRQFFIDLDAFKPAREIYRRNTRIAAEQVQKLVRGAMGERSRMDAEFIGAVAGIMMNAIHRKELKDATGMEDAEAYRALANLIVAGVHGSEG